MTTLRDLVAISLLSASPRRKAAAASVLADCDRSGSSDALETIVEWAAGGAPERPAAELCALADAALEKASVLGMRAIGITGPDYPPALAAIPDPPPVIWVLGSMDAAAARMVAIVGSRAASPYGLAVAERLGEGLARAGVTVVSGMARGCDAAAHAGALGASGRTVAVLGSGADVVYPAEHRPLHQQIVAAGAVVTEWAPGTPPRAGHFPLRNRIISGLSRATVVVEASDKSGSLITAACALEQGREVMAVPGPIVGERHRGSHALLRDGARLVASAEDILEELGWTTGPEAAPSEGGRLDPLLALMGGGEDCDVDTLASRSGQSVPAVLSRLMQLELAGEVRRLAGGRFARMGW